MSVLYYIVDGWNAIQLYECINLITKLGSGKRHSIKDLVTIFPVSVLVQIPPAVLVPASPAL